MVDRENAPKIGTWHSLRQRLFRNRASAVALFSIVVLLMVALLAGVLAPYSYHEQFRQAETKPPQWQGLCQKPGEAAVERRFLLGTDDAARDIFSRMIYGARISLSVGLLATLLSLFIGTSIGLLSGYFGGWIDALCMRFTDTVFAFPSVLLAIAITAIFDKPSFWVVFFALGVVGWTGIARLVRSQVLSLKTLDFITAARALGSSHARIIAAHILPNCLGPIVVAGTLAIGGNILGEAGLSFLGLGVQEPYPSWGGMLAGARQHYQEYWWMGIFPGLAIVLTVLSFNLFGDGLRDALDPRTQR